LGFWGAIRNVKILQAEQQKRKEQIRIRRKETYKRERFRQEKSGIQHGLVFGASHRFLALCRMDKFIYRGILILVCIILIIVLIISPVMISMWIKIQKAEVRIEKKGRTARSKNQTFRKAKE